MHRTRTTRLFGIGVGLAVLAAALAWISAPGPGETGAPPSKDDVPGGAASHGAVVSGPGDIAARAATFLSLLDDAARAAIEARGGIDAITLSHPHFYDAMVSWSHAFDACPIYIPRLTASS